MAHKILVSAPVPLELILTGFDWGWGWALGFWVLGRGLTILLYSIYPFILSISVSFYQKVLVNNPCPPVKREGAFEDTMFLIDLLKQSREKEIKEKKVCQLSLENNQGPFIVTS